MKTILKSVTTSLLVGLLAGGPCYAAASGNYTDLLPVGAPGNTTVISNGSGYSITTLAPSQTFGDALSRAPMTVYQSTSVATFNTTTAVTTMTAISGQGFVGSTTFPASWVASGRSFRVNIRGSYGTTSNPNWTWGILLGTTTILSTGAKAAPTTVTNQPFSATALCTINATGASGTVTCGYDIFITTAAGAGSGVANLIVYSTATTVAVAVDLTSQLTVNPTFLWGTSNSANTVTVSNASVEFLN